MTKKKYQDYVIKDGELVGDFEELYKDFDDPWGHLAHDTFRTSHAICINWLHAIAAQLGATPETLKVLELGAGLGSLTGKIAKAGFSVTGLELSETAVRKAQEMYPNIAFVQGDVTSIPYGDFDVIVMPEVTWYVLDKLPQIIHDVKQSKACLINLLSMYPASEQKFGREYFTNMDEYLQYFERQGVVIEESFRTNFKGVDAYLVGFWAR